MTLFKPKDVVIPAILSVDEDRDLFQILIPHNGESGIAVSLPLATVRKAMARPWISRIKIENRAAVEEIWVKLVPESENFRIETLGREMVPVLMSLSDVREVV